MKKMTPIHCLHPIFSFLGIHLVCMHHAITELFSKMPELKAPQTGLNWTDGQRFYLIPRMALFMACLKGNKDLHDPF